MHQGKRKWYVLLLAWCRTAMAVFVVEETLSGFQKTAEISLAEHNHLLRDQPSNQQT
jgi:hypothetical protein